MKSILFLIVFLFSVSFCYAEDTPKEKKSFLDLIGDYVSLRQSTSDKNVIEKPATLYFVHPSDGTKDSYSIDAGLTMNLFNSSHWLIGPTAEYHKQTQSSKEQDNFQAGATVIFIAGDVSEGLALYTQGSAKYKRDKIQVGEGSLTKLDVTPLYVPLALGRDIGPDLFRFTWQPTIGIQYETASDVLKSSQSGKVFRGYGSIEVVFYPFAKPLRRNLSIEICDTNWPNFSRTGGYSNKYSKDHNLFQVSSKFYFDDKQHVGIGIDYNDGENPEQGLLKQKLTMLSLLLKF
jgi:hypothetical protein